MTSRAAVPPGVRKVAGVAGLLDLRADLMAVGRLEEAVAENARLADQLTEVVARLEQSLVPLLEQVQDDADREIDG